MNSFDVIVVGAGNGGLVGALNLAKAGKKVLLLEKHNIPGGAGTSFVRGRFEFDVALHTLWGLGNDAAKGPLRKIFEELGVYDRVEFIPQKEIFALGLLGQFKAGFPYEKEAYLKTLCAISPAEEQGIRAYQSLVDAMAEEFYRLYDELGGDITPENFPVLFEYGSRSGQEILNAHIQHPVIRAAYSVLDVYTGIPIERIPFLLLSFLYEMRGGHHVKGGAQAISNAIIEEFEAAGGKVLYHAEVCGIDVADNRVTGVRLTDGRAFVAQSVLVNANRIRTYVDFIDPAWVPEETFQKLRVSKPGMSLFGLYIGLDCKPETVGIDHGIHFLTDPGTPRQVGDIRSYNNDSCNSVYMSCYNIDDPDYSEPGTSVLAVLVGNYVDPWLNLGQLEYQQKKFDFADDVIGLMEKFFPQLREHIEELEISSPLTHMRYLGSPGGAIYANSANFTDLLCNKLDPRSPIDGLYFCGASVMTGGFNTTYMSGYAASNVLLKDEQGGRYETGYQLEKLPNIATIQNDIAALKQYNKDPRVSRGEVTRTVNQYHPRTIKVRLLDIIPETSSSKRFVLAPLEGVLPPFIAGQYISLALNIGGAPTRRAFSISSSPSQRGFYEIAVKRKTDGFLSDYLLDQLQVGDQLEISAPAGTFFHNQVIHGKKLAFIAGGSGITPFMSILEHLYERGDAEIQVDLFYGNAREDDVIYAARLQELAEKWANFRYHLVISDPLPGHNGLTGWISGDLIGSTLGDTQGCKFYLCGPEAMYAHVTQELVALGHRKNDIKREILTSANDPSNLADWPKDAPAGQIFTIALPDGRKVAGNSSEPILNSLEREGIAYPSECRGGECSLCRAKVTSGSVFSPGATQLRKADKQLGYVHLCAAYPTSDIELQLDA